jgi:hypothetical protein
MTSRKQQTDNEPRDDKTYDPRDLVIKPGYDPETDPQEVVNNPLHTPQMLNDPGDLRDDLRE